MFLMDTHIWIWWVQGDKRLTDRCIAAMDKCAENEIGISIISCWEVAMLHSHGRISFSCSLDDWLEKACAYPGINILPLTRDAAVNSSRLPGDFHRDPADRMLVATAREH